MKRDFDHRLWKLLKSRHLEKKKFLIALSGGVDSVALLAAFAKVLPRAQLAAAYVHHGKTKSAIQKKYRRQAGELCRKLCADLDIEFYFLEVESKTNSEAELRTLRYDSLRKCRSANDFNFIALAHHRDDLLETRLLRLIRGTGAQGLQAMRIQDEDLFRPLLDFFKVELEEYLRAEKIKFLKDPSNKSDDPMRNWLRRSWLSSLEKKQKGGKAVLARSLDTLAEELSVSQGDLLQRNEAFSSQALSRAFYLSLNPTEQIRLLAQYLLARGKRDFSQSHLEEIRKRLDKVQNDLTFRVASCNWHINAEQIKVDL